ncbi:MAG: UDP-3-O-(3-hydroxymyristoyl)glucosamine N-acyltransferase [Planctomycetes bacterium]|nr:UDP-3-O-(3-hydroxymyristoyl)glucosamine N-acyltransferase [Planctomycetota bacterium]
MPGPLKLSELCRILNEVGLPAQIEGADCAVRAVNTLEAAGDSDITFLSNPKYTNFIASTKASAIIAKDGVETPSSLSVIRCRDPYGAITMVIVHLHGHRKHPKWGASRAGAFIDPTATIGEEANIAPGVTVAANVVIGKRCTLYPGCYIARGARLGDDCVLFPNVVIYEECELGNRVTIHAGSVIGEDGLGYAPQGEKWIKIPQVGRAVIGDDVEIGANCTIDRATLGTTEIGAGTKFGNVIVIGHGTKIGPDCMFVGLVGVAGSVTVGKHVTMAGQVGVAGHLEIGDGASVGAQSGIVGNVPAKATLLGSPAIPMDSAKRSMVLVQRLPEWANRVRELERELQELREQIGANGKA